MPPARPAADEAPLPSVALIGTDTVLAARPATAVQLAQACLSAGFDLALPVSWGDEVIAEAVIHECVNRGREPAIFCGCPRVAERLLGTGDDIAPFLVGTVAPPVAAARYVRRVISQPVRLTYIGTCPGALTSGDIDAQLRPAELFAVLDARGIELAAQPETFDSVIPPDRRRSLSLPGGLPAPAILRTFANGRVLATIDNHDFSADIAQRLISREFVLMDVAPRLGCACSGAVAGAVPAAARAGAAALEPPRAMHPIVDSTVAVEVIATPVPPVRAPEIAARVSGGVPAETISRGPSSTPPSVRRQTPLETTPVTERPARASGPLRRVTPTSGFFRSAPGSVPTARSGDGRSLPRAYAAHRRTPSPRSSPIVLDGLVPPDAGQQSTEPNHDGTGEESSGDREEQRPQQRRTAPRIPLPIDPLGDVGER